MLETLSVLLIVGLAVLYVGRQAWRTFAPGKPGGCGCSGAKAGCPAAQGIADKLRQAARRPA